MNIKTSNKAGFTLVEIMIVVAIIGLLAAIAIPNFVKARANSQTNTCIANLKQMDSAKEQCAMENKWDTGHAVVWGDLAPTYMKAQPTCPSGGNYTLNNVGTNPTCDAAGGLHVLP